MPVGSPLEMYTTLFGWMVYGRIWTALELIGITWIPLLFWIYTNWRAPSESQETRDPHTTSRQRLMWDAGAGFIMIISAAIPTIPLAIETVEYQPPATPRNPDPAVETVLTDSTTYGDDVFQMEQAGQGVRLPPFWYTVLTISGGVNHAIIAGFPPVEQVRRQVTVMQTMHIRDAALRHELRRFRWECHLPAYEKLMRWQSEGKAHEIQAALAADTREAMTDASLPQDPYWVGSRVFVETPGLYRPCLERDVCGGDNRAKRPVGRFPARTHVSLDGTAITRDVEPMYDSEDPPAGKPFCDRWWLGSAEDPAAHDDQSKGLQDLLLAEAIEQGYDPASYQGYIAGTLWGPGPEEEALAVRAMLANSQAAAVPSTYSDVSTKVAAPGGTAAKDALAHAGLSMVATFQHATMDPVLHALPILQALFLFGVYMLLPFVLIFGMYQPTVVIYAALTVFTVKFWSVLWHAAMWLEQHVFIALYDWRPHIDSTTNMLIGITTLSMYFLLPVIWSGLMGIAGARAVGVLAAGSSIDRGTSTASSAGQQGAQIAQRGSSIAGRAAGRAARR